MVEAMIRAVFFDLDGTLVDSEKHYTTGTKEWLDRLGYHLSLEEVYPIIGKNMEETYAYLHEACGIPIEEAVRENEKYFDHEHVIRYADYLFPDVRKTLDACKEKEIRMAVCTGSQSDLLKMFLKDCHLEGIFEETVSSDQHFPDKPDPAMYLYLLKKMKLKAEECLVVEDSKNGILSGKRAGIYTVARDASRYHVDQSEADWIVKDLIEIMEVINVRNH